MNPGIYRPTTQLAEMPQGLLGNPRPVPMPDRYWHPEALDWSIRVATNGGNPAGSLRAVSEFCWAIDAAGLRGKLWRFNPFCGGNLLGALVPLYRGPTVGGTTFGNATDTNSNFVSADYADSGANGGLKGNGTNKSLNTGFLANTLAAVNTHLGCGLVTANTTSGSRSAIGVYSGASNSFTIHLQQSTVRSACFTRFATVTDTFGPSVATSLAIGNIVAAWPTFFRDGVSVGATAATSQNYPSAHSFRVFSNANVNTPIDHTDARLGWYSIGETMTAAQVVDYDRALVALRAGLGR